MSIERKEFPKTPKYSSWTELMLGELLALFRSRRSIRFFKNDTIPDEHIKMILEAARWAPSPSNSQPWEFIVIRDPKVKEDLQNTMDRVAKTVRQKYPQFPWHTIARDPKMISEAAVIVAVCADFNRKEIAKYNIMPPEHKRNIVSWSVAAAIQNMMLMAAALGIGSVWISPLWVEGITQLLHIPETLELFTLLPLGYPTGSNLGQPRRRPIKTMVHYDKFNQTRES